MVRSRVHGRQVVALAAACGALTLLAALAPRTASAQGEGASATPQRGPIDVLILVGSATDWAARVRGQLSDLPVRARSAALPAIEEVASRSSAFARRQAATVTVWLATDGDPASPDERGAYVAVWLAGSHDLYTRRIAADWRALSAADRSAALEIAALSVRSAVRSLLLDAARAAPDAALAEPRSRDGNAKAATERDTTLPTERDTTLPTERDTTLAVSASDASVGERPVTPPLQLGSMLPSGLELEAGGTWQLYARSTPGIGALRAGVRLTWASWAFELIGQYGLPAQAQVGPARLELVRHALLGEVHYFAWEGGAWRWSPLLRAGVTSLRRRSTGSDDAAVRPLAAARYDFPTFGLGAITELALGARLSMSLRGALNIETAVPTFAVQTPSGASAWSSTPWAVQPSLEVGANWHF